MIGTTPTTNLHGYSQKALGLDGVDDYVEIKEAPEFETNQHTVSFWVKSDSLSQGNLVSKDDGNSNLTNRQWLVEALDDGKVQSVIWTNGSKNTVDSEQLSDSGAMASCSEYLEW